VVRPFHAGAAGVADNCAGGLFHGASDEAQVWPNQEASAKRTEEVSMISHVSIQCSDVQASSAFYDAVLATIGGQRILSAAM
jgi:hypothetical protein